MRRYQIFNSKDEIIHEDYFNDIDEVKEWAKIMKRLTIVWRSICYMTSL